MIRRTLVFLMVLIAVGEAILRFDEKTLFFQGDRAQILANHYKDSRERALADRGEFPHNPSDLRVMLVGDSKLYGVGIRPEHAVATLLASKLRSGLHNEQVSVLDVTLPGSNTFHNRQAFDQYFDAFAPQVVILAYNYNDAYGDQQSSGKTSETVDEASSGPARPPASIDSITDIVVRARELVFNSRVLSLALVKANMELKLAGVVVPGTEFYHLLHRSHRPDYPGWIESQKHLAEMAEVCRRRGSVLIAYIVPQLEMLRRYSVFDDLNHYLVNYFGGLHVEAVNGADPFRNLGGRSFALSRYDGHPNEEAAEIIASHLSTVVAVAWGRLSSDGF